MERTWGKLGWKVARLVRYWFSSGWTLFSVRYMYANEKALVESLPSAADPSKMTWCWAKGRPESSVFMASSLGPEDKTLACFFPLFSFFSVGFINPSIMRRHLSPDQYNGCSLKSTSIHQGYSRPFLRSSVASFIKCTVQYKLGYIWKTHCPPQRRTINHLHRAHYDAENRNRSSSHGRSRLIILPQGRVPIFVISRIYISRFIEIGWSSHFHNRELFRINGLVFSLYLRPSSLSQSRLTCPLAASRSKGSRQTKGFPRDPPSWALAMKCIARCKEILSHISSRERSSFRSGRSARLLRANVDRSSRRGRIYSLANPPEKKPSRVLPISLESTPASLRSRVSRVNCSDKTAGRRIGPPAEVEHLLVRLARDCDHPSRFSDR